MYDELVKELRDSAEWADRLALLMGRAEGDAHAPVMRKAADAIEELSKREADMTHNMAALSLKVLRAEEKQPRWIPVTERLPVGGDDSGAVCENVCLLMDDGTVSCGWMNGITKKVYYLNARDDVVIKAPITRVTHWMPLPQPPKEAERNA